MYIYYMCIFKSVFCFSYKVFVVQIISLTTEAVRKKTVFAVCQAFYLCLSDTRQAGKHLII